ncbi:dachshund homolog 2 isoform X6 [Anopheles gambiae]|uniref:dachshund homolog 2 isoform X6 n=1 Tax=Anopheles gambiae TaxID=7165 RepID=UPI002AC98686|nr:dachshund homolog 2 isoform X6 [Anopheles gambiae]
MDSAMDTASTASDHSIASSNDSRGRNISSPIQHNHNGSSSHQHQLDKTRTPTPVSPVHNSHSGGSNNGPLSNHHSSRQLSSSPLSAGGPVQMMGHMGHPLSPPHVSTPSSMAGMVGMPPRMAQNLSHLPPHGLGLLNSFMHHASPLDLMAAAHHHVPPRSYNSPPPISSSDPTANECKLVDYRGQKVAAFMIQGETMLCLPQAFELFLKHLVGGLHTVYTKLKRLDIVPLVCNVEQVRILRGLGAIQPGVNRCKLLSCKDFDVLYRDCTTARCLSIKPPERPGRPPKRGPVGLSMPTSHMPHHAQLKKHRLDNGEFVYENGHLNDLPRLDKSPLLANGYNAPPTHLNHIPFMQMNPHPAAGGHPLMSPGVNPHGIQRPDGSIIKGQNIPGMEAIARSHHTGIWENCRAAYEDIVKHLERLREERGDDRTPNVDHKPRDLSSQGSGPPLADSPNGQSPALNLSKSGVGDHGGGGASGGGVGGIGGGGAGSGSGAQSERSNPISPEPSVHEEDENMSEANISDMEEPNDKDEDISDCDRDLHSPVPAVMPVPPDMEAHRQQALNYSSLAASVAVGAVPTGQDPSISSTETLLRNIQGLLKVAADNARQQERQTSYEKAELKMDVIREREVKDSFERQLADEKRLRALYQKRFKKERRLRMQIQERLDGERKRRVQLEDIIKASGAPAEALRIIAENISSDQQQQQQQQREKERERDSEREKDREKERERDRDRREQGRDKGQEREREPLHHQQSSSSSSVDRNHREHRSTIEESLRAGDRHRVEVERERRASSSERYSKEDSPAPNLSSSSRPSQEVSPSQPPLSEGKSWNYPGLDIMATGAFWQNYSESLAQELELERKARQQAAEGEVKGPLQDRSNYYKNSVLYTSAT